MGVNINDKKGNQAFTEQILNGEKTVETRKAPTLRRFVGQRIGIVRTGVGKAMHVGNATVTEEIEYASTEEFDADYDRHLVGKDSPFHDVARYGYVLADVERVEPTPVTDKGSMIARKLPVTDSPAPKG